MIYHKYIFITTFGYEMLLAYIGSEKKMKTFHSNLVKLPNPNNEYLLQTSDRYCQQYFNIYKSCKNEKWKTNVSN